MCLITTTHPIYIYTAERYKKTNKQSRVSIFSSLRPYQTPTNVLDVSVVESILSCIKHWLGRERINPLRTQGPLPQEIHERIGKEETTAYFYSSNRLTGEQLGKIPPGKRQKAFEY